MFVESIDEGAQDVHEPLEELRCTWEEHTLYEHRSITGCNSARSQGRDACALGAEVWLPLGRVHNDDEFQAIRTQQ